MLKSLLGDWPAGGQPLIQQWAGLCPPAKHGIVQQFGDCELRAVTGSLPAAATCRTSPLLAVVREQGEIWIVRRRILEQVPRVVQEVAVEASRLPRPGDFAGPDVQAVRLFAV